MTPTFRQGNRSLEIQTPLGENILGLRSILFQEQLGRPFVIEAEMSSDDPEIAIDAILGHPVVVRLDLPGGRRRFFHAFVSRFVAVGRGPRYAHYRATLVPWLWVLTRSADCRIFQEMSVPDIIQSVFTDRGAKEFESRLAETYSPKEYCVQYRETDFNFVSRLMEEEGIYYFFQHSEEKITLALVDSVESCEPAEGYEELEFEEVHAGEVQGEKVVRWTVEKEVQPTQYALSDYNPMTPKTDLRVMQEGPREHAINDRQVFDYPGEYKDTGEGERIARMRIDELQSAGEVIRAEARCFALSSGNTFTLKRHPREDQNRKYLVTSVSLFWDAGEFNSDEQAPPRQHCEFTAIPATQTYRPPRVTPKPLIQGPQPAVVVGPEGEEIHTDEYGRVKVHFHWNRESKGDAAASCWVRVAQNWAGKKWGTFFLPRIGHEVLVEFYEADPDRPIVTGSVYNAENKPPYDLPAEKTKSTIKTLSSKGGEGYNELRFEDKKGSEEIFVHAQKNLEIRVKNAHQTSVGGVKDLHVHGDTRTKLHAEHHLKVVGNEFAAYDADRHLKVAGNTQTKIDGNLSLGVGGDRMTDIGAADNLKIATDLAIETGGTTSAKAGADLQLQAAGGAAIDASDIHLKAANTITLEAGTKITLMVGGSFIVVDPGGIVEVGPMVKMNSGGGPGSGKGCSPLSPAAPDPPDPKDPGGPPTGKPGEVTTFSSAAEALKYAALTGLPFCEECPREQPPPPPPPGPVPPETPEITSIAFIGAGDAEVADGDQWVNIPSEDTWLDADHGIDSKWRLGREIKFKVSFSIPGAHEFKVKLVPGDENLTYTGAELGRNAHFKHQTEEKTYTTDGDGTKVVDPGDIFVSAAGGQTFKLQAEFPTTGTVVETGALTTKRLGYVLPVLMEGMNAGSLGLADAYAEFANHGIDLVEMPLARIPRQPNIGSDEETDQFEQACRDAFDASAAAAKDPYALVVGFTEHLAVRHANVDLVLTGWPVGPAADGGETATIPVEATGLRAGDTALRSRALWRNLVPGEGWFVSARYEPDGGGAAVALTEADLTPVPASDAGADPCYDIEVDTSRLPAGTGTIRVRVNVVDRMRAGVAFGGNLACACLKAWWRDQPVERVSRALVHELGHKVHMVTDGSGKLPDRVPTQYDDRGHVGSHCHNGVPLQDSFSGVTTGPVCVMFGTILDKLAFCPDCAVAVKKMDLADGWPP